MMMVIVISKSVRKKVNNNKLLRFTFHIQTIAETFIIMFMFKSSFIIVNVKGRIALHK